MSKAKSSNGNGYFRTMAIVLISIAVGGFSLNGFINQDKMPSPYLLLVFHSIVMVLWFVLFILQTQLIKKGKVGLHKLLGLWSLLLTFTILITGFRINYVLYEKGGDHLAVCLNFGALINFSLCYFIGYFYRTRIEWHKRAMLLAGISVVAPAIARFVIALKLPEPTTLLGYLLLILSLVINDAVTDRKCMRFSMRVGLFIFLSIVATASLGTTETWAAFLAKIWG